MLIFPFSCWGRRKEKFIAEFSSKPDLGEVQERVYRRLAAGFMTLTSWSHALSKSGNMLHFHQVFIDEAIIQWRPRLRACIRAWRTFWTQTLVMFDICTDVHFDSHVCAVAYSGHFCFRGDLTKPSISIARVDRFYLNLVLCLQLDIALLIQNSVKIWRCLSELWQCIQGPGGYFFFLDTV